ncbi:lipocalin family protein [Xanthomonas translucens]|uniref:lipocalin family protein n=1 Tax=Xanthomonas campestris pv. translucens TaxID=343 RepID=UPI0002A79C11|nr:lipocalin family protein [Xanthomonas translucens]AKK67438.1 membrane protein [Xanthomonas translucens pv. undulosa]AVY67079.1 membrane protein [Xanthomonas translucens pv. undulosa]ELQ15642.1 lipocalin [Xanthomonas translucens DAR61454]MBC3972395.1 lipocalin family protein [Xanthomonas translucens pv. undulosa]MCT8270896.1 lipocalin family protein [Xanthomonas translucens pv. undulosa]
MRHPSIAVLLACLLCLALPARATQPVRSVAEFDLGRYAGQWHEIAHLPVSFQKKCVADITAAYVLREDGLIGVRNVCRTGKGDLLAAEGVARRVAGHPGRLQVRFAPDWLAWVPLVWADYWVIALDPEYQWVLIGEPDRKYLWVLSRSPRMPRALFEQIKATATAMGYDLDRLLVVAPLD